MKLQLLQDVSLPITPCEVLLSVLAIALLAGPWPKSQLPFSLINFAQGSSRPVNHQPPAQLHAEEHLTAGVPSSMAAPAILDSRALNGISHSMQDIVQPLDQRNIQHALMGMPDFEPRFLNS